MAKLTDPERREIIQRLAAFETPAEVAEWASEEWGKDLSIQQICYYDPNRSGETSERWRELFNQARESFLSDLDVIPLSHKAVRLRELQELYAAAKERGEIPDAADLLKQAAKEMGGKFSNLERLQHSTEDDKPLRMQWVDPASETDEDNS